MEYTQFFVDMIVRNDGYDHFRPEKKWYATIPTLPQAKKIADDLEIIGNVVGTVIYGWRSDEPDARVKHGNYSTRKCALGATTKIIQTRLCPHEVVARGGSPMRLYKGQWMDATPEEVMLACGIKA